MSHFGLRVGVLLAVCVAGATSKPAVVRGQDLAMNQIYGAGVHEYFAGNYQQAMADLSSVISAGSNDPRVYYFRGLTAIKLGNDGTADFDHGAAIEAKALDRFYPVSKSLERVQGYDRVTLEKHRALARAAAYQEKQKKDQGRYEQLRSAEEAVLRQVPAAPVLGVPAAAEPVAVPKAQKAAVPVDDPFAETPEEPAAPADRPSIPAESAEEEDPFGDKPAAEEPAEEMPADEAPAAKGGGDDPFAADQSSDTADEAISGEEADKKLTSELKAEDEEETLPPDIEAADEAEMDEPAAKKAAPKGAGTKKAAPADDAEEDDAFGGGLPNNSGAGLSAKEANKKLVEGMKEEDEAETVTPDIEAADEAEMDEPAVKKPAATKKAAPKEDDPFADDASEDAGSDDKEMAADEDKADEDTADEDKAEMKKRDDKGSEDEEDPFK